MYKENYLITKDQLSLFYREWKVEEEIANVVLVHGYTDHSGRYKKVAGHFIEKKINFFAFDLRGHGQSEGERTSINSFHEYIDDLKEFINHLDLKKPVYLLGHSMGGLISVNYLLNQPNFSVKGLILSAPALIQNASVSPFKIKMVMLLSKVYSKKRSKFKIDSNSLSNEKEVIDEYNNDPYVFNQGAKWNFLGELMKAMNSIPALISKFNLPVIIFHDSNDKLSNPKGSKFLIENCSSKIKSLEIIENKGHELLQSSGNIEITKKMISWIDEMILYRL